MDGWRTGAEKSGYFACGRSCGLSWGKQIGKAILVTGDSDFVPAVIAAKDAGVLVQLYYSRSSVHDELLSAVDESFEITRDLIDKVKRET